MLTILIDYLIKKLLLKLYKTGVHENINSLNISLNLFKTMENHLHYFSFEIHIIQFYL